MSTRSISISIVTGGWTLAIAIGSVLGQWQESSTTQPSRTAAQRSEQGNWAPRFSTPGTPPAALATRPVTRTAPAAAESPVFSRSVRPGKAIQANYQVGEQDQGYSVWDNGDASPELVPAPEPLGTDELQPPSGQPGCKDCNKPGMGAQFATEYDDDTYGFEDDGAACSTCGGAHQGECEEEDCYPLLHALMLRDVVVFAGAHGFKGPADLGQNGNFGFQEGVNFGAPLGDPWGLGYQIGFNAVQSDFSGYRSDVPDINDPARRGSRNQTFLTAGIFKRATVGPQWGVVFDLQRDQYYGWTDLKQVRSESGWVFANGTEIGYFGAYKAGGDNIRTNLFLQPTDMFVGFVRRYFETGAEGRLWGGLTGMGDGLVGADFRVPLGGSFALENRFNYLLPKQGRGVGGLGRESWGLVMQLTWYPGKQAACMNQRQFLPLINVADNATFMQQLQTR